MPENTSNSALENHLPYPSWFPKNHLEDFFSFCKILTNTEKLLFEKLETKIYNNPQQFHQGYSSNIVNVNTYVVITRLLLNYFFKKISIKLFSSINSNACGWKIHIATVFKIQF